VLEIAGAGLTSALVAYLLGRTEPSPPAPPSVVVQIAPVDEEIIRSVRSDQAALLDQLRNDADARKQSQISSQVIAPQAMPQVAPPTAPQVKAQEGTPQLVMPQAVATDVAVSASDFANASAPAKPDRSMQASTRRDQKPERIRLVATKPDAKVDIKTDAKPRLKAEPRTAPRAEEVPQARPLPSVVDPGARNVGPRNVAAAPSATPAPDRDTGLSSALRGITARLLPSRDRSPGPDQGAARPPMPVGEFQQTAM
jgi:hypothetical protein